MAGHSCGYRSLRIQDDARSRPVALDVWYPVSPALHESPHSYGLGDGHVIEDAPPIGDSLPALVLSHGAFGSARNYGWIAEDLARHGYVVCGVSHFGESPVYGPETIDPATVVDLSGRMIDCAFALDRLMSGAVLDARLDAGRVGAIGHSSGGATVIALAGGVFDPGAMAAYCASDAARADRGCDYARRPQGSAIVPAIPQPRSYRDPRVRAVVGLDPALGPGFEATSLAEISIPVHIVGAVENDFLPIDAHAGRYARSIPGAAFTRLTEGEGHFVYLNACAADIEANGVSLCRDRDGVDRDAVHGRITSAVTAFFDEALSPEA